MQIAIGVDVNADGVIGTEVGRAANDDEWQGNFIRVRDTALSGQVRADPRHVDRAHDANVLSGN